MILHLLVKNFGKIESADISLNNMVVFVGNNNSGKTMIMQLIYGIRKELIKISVPTSGAEQSDFSGQCLIRCSQSWFKEVESYINQYLENNKSRIITDIFGTSIPIGEIKISLRDEKSLFYVCSISEFSNRSVEEQIAEIDIDIRQYENGQNTKSFKSQIDNGDCLDDVVNKTLQIVWKIILSGKDYLDSEQLFFPASRSGLQLLYRYYFAGEIKENMVMPIKDFLRFLQLYSEDLQLNETRKDLLKFGEEHLLKGKIVQRENETFYIESQEGRKVPLYIASSMIHELTPFIKMLNATQQIDWFYCDEVENSLHPLLQREMARWLIRMVNAGMHVMISSHSDTMASRLNNLFMLSQLDRRKVNYTMLSDLELMKADLLDSDMKADVYEFRIGKNGKTIVERLEFINYPLMGYDFQLFDENLDKLGDEADKITR